MPNSGPKKRKIVYLTNKNSELVGKCDRALREIFARYDADKDGALNDQELDNFAKGCNGTDTGFSVDEKDQIKENFQHNDAGDLTLNGFLQLYSLQTMSEPSETWKDLKAHGYDSYLELNTEEQAESAQD
mmetsp:Transcript_5447/g.6627  ORF Transcript_5447/g.6627 Transcript_5447/m.6627 type:complete len:130 (-) Transcript_5447:235-624(-)|eukprot:CAMPEP_0206194042 /NCGR_PEP_ID=MMETSP0166-20121206/6950_1 /ASSEMBLY_ACC=CAM_ASM_000260 /TAXON_ID=95228 /ORGANISM="Vannella robusta, Strain DIVA3 518/3/11/1/6" /LENGTH=129 /DNA_ID=CAMNT_0053610917 /DNA_START=187 /DNA_END=576 /DNA_ORIENTATION=+